MNKEEAEIEAEQKNEVALRRFCPLIKDTCRKDCVSFKVATMEETLFYNEPPSGMFHVTGGYCNSPMLWKED